MQPSDDHTKARDRSLYEAIPYPHYVFPQTSPDNLAVLSKLYGLIPASASSCRYLELGCGNGTNVAAFASRYPASKFVGIDFAENHIISAKKAANELTLKNVEFIAADLMDVDPDLLGQFDFVVAHGLFSWVPDAVRIRILELMNRCVKPNGVGYISYNALPGCHIRRIGWDLLRFATREIPTPRAKIAAATGIANFVARNSPEGSPQQSIYELMIAELVSRRPENILHDDLSEVNRPFYFFEFAELLSSHGLKYLCEADPRSHGDGNLSASAREELDRISSGHVEREQLLDFLDFASFRQGVICHVDAEVLPALSPDHLRELFCDWSLRPKSTDPSGEAGPALTFNFEEASVETDHPLTASILSAMNKTYPLPINIGETIDFFLSELPGIESYEKDERQALSFLLDLYKCGFIQLFTERPSVSIEREDNPEAHHFARWQAANGLDTFTTLRGENIAFSNEVVRVLVSLLDGTRDRQSLINEILDRLKLPPDQAEEARSSMPAIIDANIEQLRRLGVLVR